MSSIISESEKNQWVYLMGQNYQKIKLEKYVLESSKAFQQILREIEENLDSKSDIVIFLPGVELKDLEQLVKYVAKESSMKLKEVCCLCRNILNSLILSLTNIR